jgi:hypothetical protein
VTLPSLPPARTARQRVEAGERSSGLGGLVVPPALVADEWEALIVVLASASAGACRGRVGRLGGLDPKGLGGRLGRGVDGPDGDEEPGRVEADKLAPVAKGKREQQQREAQRKFS